MVDALMRVKSNIDGEAGAAYADWLKKSVNPATVVEFGCNDGILLKPLSALGVNACGIDVSANITEMARERGLNVLTGYFNAETAGRIEEKVGKADVVTLSKEEQQRIAKVLRPIVDEWVKESEAKGIPARQMLKKAGSTDTEKMIAAMQGLTVSESPSGPFTYRRIDHQATMGAWVGKTAVKDGKPVMVDWSYRDGKDHLPPDDEVRKMRPGD